MENKLANIAEKKPLLTCDICIGTCSRTKFTLSVTYDIIFNVIIKFVDNCYSINLNNVLSLLDL